MFASRIATRTIVAPRMASRQAKRSLATVPPPPPPGPGAGMPPPPPPPPRAPAPGGGSNTPLVLGAVALLAAGGYYYYANSPQAQRKVNELERKAENKASDLKSSVKSTADQVKGDVRNMGDRASGELKGAGYSTKAQAHEAAAQSTSGLDSLEHKAKGVYNSALGEGERASGKVTGELKELSDNVKSIFK